VYVAYLGAIQVRLALGIIAALLVIDTITKLALDKPPLGWHQSGGSPSFLGLIFAWIAVSWSLTRFTGAVLFAGVLANTLWQFNPTGVPNVFVYPGQNVAYNLADVFIVIGGYSTALLVVASPVLFFVKRRSGGVTINGHRAAGI
jgi:hypothetical protein